MDCKWCSRNYEQQRIKNIKNPIKRFFEWMNWVQWHSIVHLHYPKCTHPEVYRNNIADERVHGKLSREEIFCSAARLESSGSFHCCGKEGKYFEEYKENE